MLRAGRAGAASRINTLFSIPMLFMMGSASHLPSWNAGGSDAMYWLIAGGIIVAALLIINEINDDETSASGF